MINQSVNENRPSLRPLFRLIIPRVPYPNVFSHLARPPLGIIYVATSVKENGLWDVEVIDELNWKNPVSKRDLGGDSLAEHRDLQSRRPAQAVGFYGGLTSTVPRLFDIAKFYQSLGVPTVTGGAHVDALPDEALREGIDVVVHGEGEETIIEILKAWSDNHPLSEIHGISFTAQDGSVITTEKRKPICNLDDLPIPDFDLLVELRKPLTIVPFERTRGCNFNCEFCVVHDRFGPSRSASPERVAAELEKRIDSGYRRFFCVDDNFTQGKKSILRLLGLIKDIKKRRSVKLDFTIQARSSVGRDETLMQALRDVGVHMIAIGLESPISEDLKGMDKHQTPEQIERDVKSLRGHGFMIHGMFIFGYPLENCPQQSTLTLRERADRFIQFIKRTRIDTIQVLKPVPIPGSRLAKRLAAQDRIFPLKIVGWDKYDGSFLTFLPDCGTSASELQKQANRIMRSFYSPFSFLKFPVLVFTTPVEIFTRGFLHASEFARNPAIHTQAAIKDGVKKITALKVGFREAGFDVNRTWRNAAMRTLGSMIVTNAYKAGHHTQFVEFLNSLNP